jgi:hypothetical protein
MRRCFRASQEYETYKESEYERRCDVVSERVKNTRHTRKASTSECFRYAGHSGRCCRLSLTFSQPRSHVHSNIGSPQVDERTNESTLV